MLKRFLDRIFSLLPVSIRYWRVFPSTFPGMYKHSAGIQSMSLTCPLACFIEELAES